MEVSRKPQGERVVCSCDEQYHRHIPPATTESIFNATAVAGTVTAGFDFQVEELPKNAAEARILPAENSYWRKTQESAKSGIFSTLNPRDVHRFMLTGG